MIAPILSLELLETPEVSDPQHWFTQNLTTDTIASYYTVRTQSQLSPNESVPYLVNVVVMVGMRQLPHIETTLVRLAK